MANYDPQNLESVLFYIRQEFGASVFREAGKTYSIVCDLSPKLKAYGNILRQLIERGTLAELEAASGDELRRDRAVMKARDILENEMFLRPDIVNDILGAVGPLYGLTIQPTQAQAVTPPTPQAVTPPQAQPVPTPTKIVKSGECGDNVRFMLDSRGVLTISGNGPVWDFEWDRKAQAYNTPWWYRNKTITQAKIQRGVTTIGNHAFARCAWLTSVTIPNSVTTIGAGAFFDCAGLTSVTIPDSVTTIGGGAFADCKKLTSVMIPDSVTTIGNNAFEACEWLTSVMIPDSVTTIRNGTFARCVRLTSVTIPDSVTYIGDVTFYDCISLTSVTIPDSVTTIGEYAFDGCAKLRGVSVPKNVRIGNNAFPRGLRVTRRR